jgi:hypothetical protein
MADRVAEVCKVPSIDREEIYEEAIPMRFRLTNDVNSTYRGIKLTPRLCSPSGVYGHLRISRK